MYLFKNNDKDTRTAATERCSSSFDVDFKHVVVTLAGSYFSNQLGNTRTISEICSKLTMKTPKRRQWCCTGLVHLLLNINTVHTLTWCFHYWRWRSKYRLVHGYFNTCFIVEANIVWNVNMFLKCITWKLILV